MTGLQPLDDLDIRAMLDARVGRLHPGAAHDVLVSVSAQLVRASGGLDVPVAPVAVDRRPSPRRARLAGGVAAAVAIVVFGALLAGLPGSPDRVTVGGSPAATESTATTMIATPLIASPALAGMTADALRAGIASGDLDGRTVLLTVDPAAGPLITCPSTCLVAGPGALGGVDVRSADPDVRTADLAATIAAHVGQPRIAFRILDGGLELLGWPQQDPNSALTVTDLIRPNPPTTGDGNLLVVAGWLNGALPAVTCRPLTSPANGCERSWPTISDTDRTGVAGSAQGDAIEVEVDDAVGLGLSPATAAGPFLVQRVNQRGGESPQYHVVARLDPATAITLDLTAPSVSAASGSPAPASPSSSPPPAAVLTAAELRAGIEDGSLVDHVVIVDGDLIQVALPCPAPGGPQCIIPALRGLDGIRIVAGDPSAHLPDTFEPVHGTFAFRGGTDLLTYLGPVSDVPGQPVPVTALDANTGAFAGGGLIAVTGWLVVGGVHSCPLQLAGATPCAGPGPWLTDDRPFEDGMLASGDGLPVSLEGTLVGHPAGQVVTQGPFLVRRVCGATSGATEAPATDPGCAGGPLLGWQVVAVFNASTTVRAAVP